MTRRLFWEDPYRTKFAARVVRAWSEGGKHYTVLDQTLFYPTAGGQPHDTGVLGGVRVVDVQESQDKEEIVHVLEAPLEEGAEVEGEIDWPRRYRHMQRHTAQHILSQAFVRAGGWPTVTVNLQSPVMTVDLAAEPDEGVVRRAEALANWAVYTNLPIRAFLVEEDEARRLPLRRPPKVTGHIRVVEIEDWDLAACGGTHLRSSTEAGPIKVLRLERHRGGTRVYFTAGWEALEDYAQKHAVLQRLAERFSAQPLEVPQRVEKLEAQLYEARGEAARLRKQLADRVVRELLDRHPGRTIAAEVPLDVLNDVGRMLSKTPGTLALLVALAGKHARVLLTKHPSRTEDLPEFGKSAWRRSAPKGAGRNTYKGRSPTARCRKP